MHQLDVWSLEVKRNKKWKSVFYIPFDNFKKDRDIKIELKESDKNLLSKFKGNEIIRLISPIVNAKETEVLHYNVKEFGLWDIYKSGVIAIDPNNTFREYKITDE